MSTPGVAAPRPLAIDRARAQLQAVTQAMSTAVRGHDQAIVMVVAAHFGGGHILIEDVPGVGKTTLVRSLARVLGLEFSRIQFTADLLPADLLGLQMLRDGRFEFRPGPLFAELVLADEINRASPKTQSALLEAMAERQVTVDDQTYPLPAGFCVIASQNPVEHHGVYPLPESQLDRFTIRLTLGYPAEEEELKVLTTGGMTSERLAALPVVLDADERAGLRRFVDAVRVDPRVADYVLRLLRATRDHPDVVLGGSTRAGLAWLSVGKGLAAQDGRDYVLPDDIKASATAVLAHRLVLRDAGPGDRMRAVAVVSDVTSRVPSPR